MSDRMQFEFDTYNPVDHYPGCEDEPTFATTYPSEPSTQHEVEQAYAMRNIESLVEMTNDQGIALGHFDQPLPGSVVMVQGDHGTAWQRHFNDLLWHSTRGGRPRTWSEMLADRNLRMAYSAPVR